MHYIHELIFWFNLILRYIEYPAVPGSNGLLCLCLSGCVCISLLLSLCYCLSDLFLSVTLCLHIFICLSISAFLSVSISISQFMSFDLSVFACVSNFTSETLAVSHCLHVSISLRLLEPVWRWMVERNGTVNSRILLVIFLRKHY